MLAFALAPTVSRATEFLRGTSSWAEVCTPQGLRAVAVGAVGARDEAPVPVRLAGSLEHCAFCGVSGDSAALQLGASPGLPLPTGPAPAPRLGRQAEHPAVAWRGAPPRGPPAHG